MSISSALKLLVLIIIPLVQYPLSEAYANASPTATVDTNDASWASGSQSIVVILVEFKNLDHKKTRDEVAKAILEDLNRYIKEVSYDAAWVVGEVTDWVKLPYDTSSYGRDFGPFIDVEVRRLVCDSIHAVNGLVNFNLYKHIMVIHAGKGQETTGALSDLWSGYLTIRPPLYADGLIINKVIVVPEEEAGGKNPLGVYAHEFMHSLGLPDLYPASSLKSQYMGPWDVMDTGLRNGEPPGSSPSHPGAWSKITLGWRVRTRTIYSGSLEEVTLTPLEVPSENVQAVILPITSGRYYFVEVRLQSGFDTYLPEKGVLISYVDEKLAPGNGMVRVIDADPSTPGLRNAAFNVGQSYIDKSRLVRISVTSEDTAFTLTIDRRISINQTLSTPMPQIR